MEFQYTTINPPKHLEPFVRYFWVFEGGNAGTPYVYRSMADPCAELLFHYWGTFDEYSTDASGTDRREASFRSGIHAQTARYRRFAIAERFGIVGVYLYPYAANELFGIPASELTDQMPDLTSALGATGRELEERVCTAVDTRRALTDIALDCGYYDQAHFIRDFTAFSGYRPSDYFSGTSEGIEWRETITPAS